MARSFIVSCEGADLRLTSEGVLAYTNDGFRQIPVTPFRGVPGRGNVIDAQLVVAQNWSAVIAGQKDGATAARDTVSGINAIKPA